MPPTPNNNFPRSDQLEVVCPLKNHDGGSCRKRCLGEKRFRSMQEHIRRAHPDHYIPKLPATEESFQLMINTPPSDRPRPPQSPHQPSPHHHHSPIHQHHMSGPAAPISSYSPQFSTSTNSFAVDWAQGSGHTDYGGSSLYKEPYGRKDSISNHAAEVLAQMQHHVQPTRSGTDFGWDNDQVGFVTDNFNENNGIVNQNRLAPLDPPTDPQLMGQSNDRYPDLSRPRDLLSAALNRSPPYYRSSTLPPVNVTNNGGRAAKPNRPRKSSITENARKPKHERQKSREKASRRMSYDRKAMSAEPSSMAAISGRRWEDLIDAAASATEEGSRDVTPVPGIHSPRLPNNRASLPPLLQPPFTNHLGPAYTASPLQRTLTPPPGLSSSLMDHHNNPFQQADVESSIASSKSGHAFHIPSTGLSDSSPQSNHPHFVQIYCAACHRLSILKDSFACTECICGLCKACVDAIYAEQFRRRLACCPKCNAVGGKFKPFQLDFR